MTKTLPNAMKNAPPMIRGTTVVSDPNLEGAAPLCCDPLDEVAHLEAVDRVDERARIERHGRRRRAHRFPRAAPRSRRPLHGCHATGVRRRGASACRAHPENTNRCSRARRMHRRMCSSRHRRRTGRTPGRTDRRGGRPCTPGTRTTSRRCVTASDVLGDRCAAERRGAGRARPRPRVRRRGDPPEHRGLVRSGVFPRRARARPSASSGCSA